MNDEISHLESAIRYSADYYLFYAKQRMQTFLVLLFFYLAESVGFYSLLQAGHYKYVAALTIFSFFITILLWLLEARNKELLEHGRSACMEIEKELSLHLKREEYNLNIEHLTVVQKGSLEDKAGVLQKMKSHTFVVNAFFVLILLLHIFIIFAEVDFSDVFKMSLGK